MSQTKSLLPKKLLWTTWILVFVIKLLFSIGYSHLSSLQKPERRIGSISIASGDYYSYIGSMENYAQKGNYYFINQLGDTVRAGRPPHFALPYLLARKFTDRPHAADFLTIVNVALDSIAIVCMAIMAMGLGRGSRRTFFIAIALGVISGYVSNWAFITLPDSPGAALFMIGLFYYWKAYSSGEKRNSHTFWASLFFSWSIMLRPYLIVTVFLFALIFFFRKKLGFAAYRKLFVMAAIPFALFILPWMARNYKVMGRIIPFQEDVYAGYGYKPAELETRKLLTALGEDGGSFWDPTAMASYFSPERNKTSVYHYPNYLKKDTLLVRQIEDIRKEYITTLPTIKKHEGTELVAKVSNLRSTYIKAHGLRYFLLNPIRRSIKFWGHSGSYYISVDKGNRMILFADKLIQSGLYYLVLIFGTIGLLRLGRKNEMGYIMLLPVILLTIMFPLVFGFMEPRYALSFYYPGLVGLVLLVDPVLEFLRLKKRNMLPGRSA